MLIDLAAPLELGGAFTATLQFSSGRSLDAVVTVSDNPPG
jgi:copper(I)-binding protein